MSYFKAKYIKFAFRWGSAPDPAAWGADLVYFAGLYF